MKKVNEEPKRWLKKRKDSLKSPQVLSKKKQRHVTSRATRSINSNCSHSINKESLKQNKISLKARGLSSAKSRRSSSPYIKTRAQKSRLKTRQSLAQARAELSPSTRIRTPIRKNRNICMGQRAHINPINSKDLFDQNSRSDESTTECSDSDINDSEYINEVKDYSNERTVTSDSEVSIKSEIPTSIVKVYCTHCWPSFSYPWTTAGQTHSSSTGIIWSTDPYSRMLLTNAHSVQNAAVVQVRKRGDHKKYEAKVLCVGYDCDLALLTVEEDDFWTEMNALKWGKSPHLEDPVTVVGYPLGGDNTCVTQGVVSRIDFQRYAIGSCSLLAIQIDAAINGGNSGGPALNSDKECVGIAFQSLKDSETENISYIIPSEVVYHFMEDYSRHHQYTGFGSSCFTWQKVENRCMQEYYGIDNRAIGILVSKVDKTAAIHNMLRKGDIVLAIDDNEIATDGTVSYSNGERIAFEWLLCQKFVGETSKFRIKRKEKEKELDIPINKWQPLVPTYLPEDQKPEYFIAGGLVFVPLTELFLTSEYGQDCLCRAPSHLMAAANRTHKEFEDEQIVVIGHVLAHEITVGYEDYSHYCVKKFNDETIKNLSHLTQLIENCTETYWKFELDCEMVIILDAKAALESLPEILKQNMIPFAQSYNFTRQDRRKKKPYRNNYN